MVGIPLRQRKTKWEREKGVTRPFYFDEEEKMYAEQLKCGGSIKSCLWVVCDGLLFYRKFGYLLFPKKKKKNDGLT